MAKCYRIFRIVALDLEIEIFAYRIIEFEFALLH